MGVLGVWGDIGVPTLLGLPLPRPHVADELGVVLGVVLVDGAGVGENLGRMGLPRANGRRVSGRNDMLGGAGEDLRLYLRALPTRSAVLIISWRELSSLSKSWASKSNFRSSLRPLKVMLLIFLRLILNLTD